MSEEELRPDPEPEPPGPAPAAPAPARPAWSYLLTPVAVLLGAAAVVAAVVATGRGDEPDAADSLAPAIASLSATAGSL